MSIKDVTKNTNLDRIEWRKRIYVTELICLGSIMACLVKKNGHSTLIT